MKFTRPQTKSFEVYSSVRQRFVGEKAAMKGSDGKSLYLSNSYDNNDGADAIII